MTEAQYHEFVKELTQTFPGIVNSIVLAKQEPQATFRRWYPVVQGFEYSDALDVLKELTIKGMTPADIRMPMHVVRAMLAKIADGRRKKREAERKHRDAAERRGIVYQSHESNTAECFLELRPIHKQYIDGEISAVEYEREKDRVLSKLK